MDAMSLFSFASSSKFPSSPFSHAAAASSPSSSASLDIGLPKAKTVKIASTSPWFEETKGRIAKLLDKNEITISTYDTAWVAMVPSPFSSTEPCFSDSLHWLLENQCHDGSWARPHHHSLLKKDVLSSTLASILALKKWGLGQQHIDKGLHFVESNFGWAADESQITPMGFEVTFPAMLDQARALSLNPTLEQTTLNHVMSLRDSELKRIYSSTDAEAYMAYIGEGLMLESMDVMKYQRKNGSLFNSPSSTAAAFIALPDFDCLKYLNSVSNKFGGAVPAVYPIDIYSHLRTIDDLQRLGISRHFVNEIQNVLDRIYICWVQGDEEIFMDASTCALAFRILRMNGYSVASDPVTKIEDDGCLSSCVRDENAALECFRASELMLHPHETELEKQNLRLRSILEQQLSSSSIQSSQLNAEVKQALDYPFYAVLDRMTKQKTMEHYNFFDNTRMLKTSFCLANMENKDLLHLSVEDFNRCQAIHREELREFERWVVENRLDELEFVWHKGIYGYFTAAATIFAPESSDARMSWAKNALLVLVIDDLFDVRGSVEEMRKLIELVELLEVDVSTECCSHDVQIIFSALKNTIYEDGDRGSELQGRNIISHITSIWLDLLYSFMKEVEWRENEYTPTLDEYMCNAYVSIGLGPIVLLPLYLLGPKISEEMVNNHSGYHRLFKSLSTCGRLLNDIRGYEREAGQGKVCAVPLYIAENGGEMSTEDAVSEIKRSIDVQRREVLRLVVEEDNDGSDTSVVPRECKELFWHMSTVLHLFYNKDDGYASKELIQVLNDIVHRPIVLEEF